MADTVHIEFAADDPAALAGFYASVFGWRTEVSDVSSDYVLWSFGEGDGELGGGIRRFHENESRAPSARVLVYINVDDIDGKLTAVEANGGTRMVEKTAIGGGHGHYACFGDPAGNTVGLWSRT